MQKGVSKRKRMDRNQAFAERIRKRYGRTSNPSWGTLVYRKQQKAVSQIHIHKNWQQFVSNTVEQKMQRYEKKYYQRIEGRDRNRLLRSVEEIYRHPGEKKQLVHLFRKFGVVTGEHREWQENSRRMSRYEEELTVLHKQFRQQEERDEAHWKQEEEHYRKIDEMIRQRHSPKTRFGKAKNE